MRTRGTSCPCTSAATVTVEWECRHGHKGYAALCREHGAIHVAALMSEDIRCGQCRSAGTEAVCVLRRVNGKAVGNRPGRQVLLQVGKSIYVNPQAEAEITSLRTEIRELREQLEALRAWQADELLAQLEALHAQVEELRAVLRSHHHVL